MSSLASTDHYSMMSASNQSLGSHEHGMSAEYDYYSSLGMLESEAVDVLKHHQTPQPRQLFVDDKYAEESSEMGYILPGIHLPSIEQASSLVLPPISDQGDYYSKPTTPQ
jgi:hypothetical protein